MPERDRTDRRTFLKLATFGLAGSTVVLADEASSAQAATASEGEETLYRETVHVRHYYEVARF